MIETKQALIAIDASKFQKPLGKLAEVLSQKVKREATKLLGTPGFVALDLHVLSRQAQNTYDLFFYLNADETRADSSWRPAYTVVALPLIRNMIDCLYNITAILEDPRHNGPWFRKAGYMKLLKGLDEDEERYGGKPEWDEWIARGRAQFASDIREQGFTMNDVRTQKEWPTLGQYINRKQKGDTLSPHQEFLRTLLYGRWREYSAMAHGASDGLFRTAVYYIADSLPHEERPRLEEKFPQVLGTHLSQVSGLLLCIVTELQARFHFDGANIDERIHQMWDVLMPTFVVKELYDERYRQLMKDKHIIP